MGASKNHAKRIPEKMLWVTNRVFLLMFQARGKSQRGCGTVRLTRTGRGLRGLWLSVFSQEEGCLDW